MMDFFQTVPAFPGEELFAPYAYPGRTARGYACESAAGFEEYAALLEGEGFTLRFENKIGENAFKTYVKNGAEAHVSFFPAEKALRVSAGKETVFPAQPAAKRRAKTTLYQFETDHTLIDCGMCYIIRCEDNSFFIVDSAHYYSFNDNDRIYKFLRDRTPKGEKPVIAGWYFSHGHVDHVGKFMDFLRYSGDCAEIEGLFFNFAPRSHRDAAHWGAETSVVTENFEKLTEAFPHIPQIKLLTGQKFRLRNLELEVLLTHEDVWPHSCADYNTTSSVLSVRAEGTRALFPGDSSGVASDIMEKRYGAGLACDILQVSHHGHFGLSPEFYRLANARAALFPTTQIKYDEELPMFEANRVALELCEHSYISSNGTVAFDLPYAGGEARFLGDETFEDFDKIFGLWGYEYSDLRKKELREAFKRRNGSAVTLFQSAEGESV